MNVANRSVSFPMPVDEAWPRRSFTSKLHIFVKDLKKEIDCANSNDFSVHPALRKNKTKHHHIYKEIIPGLTVGTTFPVHGLWVLHQRSSSNKENVPLVLCRGGASSPRAYKSVGCVCHIRGLPADKRGMQHRIHTAIHSGVEAHEPNLVRCLPRTIAHLLRLLLNATLKLHLHVFCASATSWWTSSCNSE